MKKLINRIRAKIEQQRILNACSRQRELEARFDVAEHKGYLYLTCDGIAYAKLDEYVSAAEVVAKLKEARQAATNFLKNY